MARIVIAGLGAGGFAALLSARKTDRDAEIIVIDEKDYDLMHPCGIPYAVEGAIGSFSALKHDLSLPGMRVAQYRNYRAARLDVENKIVFADSIFSGEEEKVSYDRLIVATGSRALVPPVEGLRERIGKGAYTVSSPDEAERVRAAARANPDTFVIGAGAIGLELASALSDIGCRVIVVEMLDSLFPKSLDPDMAEILKQYLDEKKITFMMGSKVEAVRGVGKVEEVVVDGEEFPCGLLIIGAGVRPNLDLVGDCGIATTQMGIVTDERMAAGAAGVFAVGDCAQTFDVFFRKPCWIPLSSIAYRQGTVAGANAAGGDMKFGGVAGAFVSKVGEMEVAAVGLTTAAAKGAGFNPIFGKIKDLTRPDWYPNGREIHVKVIIDRETRRVLGAQAIGVIGAAWRINVVSAAICAGMTADQLSGIELAYCPPVSQTYDALTKAVDLAIRKIK
jgi:NADH oxidase (H2O2-forming)